MTTVPGQNGHVHRSEPDPLAVGRGRSGRRTRQGEAVLRAVQASAEFRSAQDIHRQLRNRGDSAGLTTVYRHLQALADDGTIDALQTSDGQAVYRYCQTRDHHHHIVCRQCGASEEIEGPEVEAWARSVAERLGYTSLSHTVEIFGLCGPCGAGSRKAPAIG